MTEESPIRENKDSYYNSNKVQIEKFLQGFVKEHTDLNLVLLRPVLLAGPNINNMFSKLWELPISSLPMGSQAFSQFIHEEDLGEALYLALKKDIRGIYNVAADDAIPTKLCFTKSGCIIVPLPMFLIKVMAYVGFKLRLFPAGPGWASMGQYTIYSLSDKFKRDTGWKPKYTSMETFDALPGSQGKKA